MKANELMIGDWVLDKKTNRPYKIIGTNDLLFHDDYSHIPLTAEILERNGFENDFYHDECVADYHYVRLEGYSYHEELILIQWCNGELNVVNELICDVDMYDCYYVHQLQHALRLCNIEKEIEL